MDTSSCKDKKRGGSGCDCHTRWEGAYNEGKRKMTNGRIITQLGVCDRYVRSEEGAHIKRGLPVLSIIQLKIDNTGNCTHQH